MAGKLIDSRNRILMNTPHSMDTSQSPIASFTANSTLPLKSCKIWFQPTQDMHGYTKPWPAGGGNNIWDEQWEVGTYNTDTGSKTAVSTRIRSKNYIDVQPSTTYYFYFGSGSGNILFYNGSTYLSRVNKSSSSTFTTPENCTKIAIGMANDYGTTYNNDIAINYPATVTAYSPYANICPITGHAGMTVYKGPAAVDNDYVYYNQVMHNIDDAANTTHWAGSYGTVSYNDERISFVPNNSSTAKNFGQKSGSSIAGIAGHKYYFSCRLTISNLHNKTPYIAPQLNNLIAVPNMTANMESTLSGVFTATTTDMLRFYFYPWGTSGITTDGTERVTVRDVMIVDLTEMFGTGKEPTTASAFKTMLPNAYYPYNAGVQTTLNGLNGTGVVDVYSVEFTTAPDGVVYGGYVDLAKGTLTATKVLRKINYCDGVFGATNYGYAVYVTLSNKTASTDTTSNMFQKSTQTYTAAPLYSYPTSSGANTTWTFILPSTVTSKAEANTWLAALDPPLVVTENLATPVTYEIPKEKIKTMLGLNNFWTDDANDTIAVSYWEH